MFFMPSIVKHKINGKEYFYLRKSVREDGKVKSKAIAYLGKTREEAGKKAEEFLKKIQSQQNLKAEKTNNNVMEENIEFDYDRTIELALRKSLFYPSAEIYANSPAGFWDFGPIGQGIRRKIVEFWRKEFVNKENILEIHGAQILPSSVFEGSGHLRSFADPIVFCLRCKKYYRADHLIKEKFDIDLPESTPLETFNSFIKEKNLNCPSCSGSLGEVNKFSLMVESLVGKQGDVKTFLRPEACQSIFLNFRRMCQTMRLKLPQGIAQFGGAFRNEISPRQSITRSIEFSQMEAEVFFDVNKINEVEKWDSVKDYKIKILLIGEKEIQDFSAQELVDKKIVQGKLIAYYLARTQQLWNKLGIPLDHMRFREVDKDERAFYSLLTLDFEVKTSIGWLELIANNYRTDYDLKGHMAHSKTNLEYTDDEGNKIIPHVWEISSGVDRTMFALVENSMRKNKDGIYLALNPLLASYSCAIFPLMKKDEMKDISKKILDDLRNSWIDVIYDESGSIGRRYARQDEIGTPYCITVDGDSIKNNDVTIRDRDSGKQFRISTKNIKNTLRQLLDGEIQFSDLEK